MNLLIVVSLVIRENKVKQFLDQTMNFSKVKIKRVNKIMITIKLGWVVGVDIFKVLLKV